MTPARRLTVTLVGLIVLVVVGWFARDVGGQTAPPPTGAPAASSPAERAVPGASSGLPVRPMSELPEQVAQTWELIERGGPFPHPGHDGAPFQNREEILPVTSRGHYAEFTVPTPGSPDRGARRLVIGSEDEVYYTADHYDSFVVVDVER
ncbi:ribonuclease domain-containing protein [Umezawaea beigongshangensis]|uniref:ribonuclease domain-containing protein n=1 Tax=Umezawaea beigongshangensis TaxID=2780383 RepID=UPI0018F2687B|nr:ribonuclease domain-containing protein [Umezawaea beigongshangensis]